MKKNKTKQKTKRIKEKTHEQDRKVKLTDNKIKSLKKIKDIYDLYYIMSITKKDDFTRLMLHYKKIIKELKRENLDKNLRNLIKKYKDQEKSISDINEELIRKITEEYENLKSEISTRRKKGADMFIEDLLLMSVPFKIKIFESTKNKKDFYNVKKRLMKVRKNLHLEL